jgi:hypothetical protein
LDILERIPERRHAIFAHNLVELVKPYRDQDSELLREMRYLSGEKCLYVVKGYVLRTLKDWNSETVAKSILLWKRPSPEWMPVPLGTEMCHDTDSIMSVIWDGYTDYCIESSTRHVEIVKGRCIPEDRVLRSFSLAVTAEFARQ